MNNAPREETSAKARRKLPGLLKNLIPLLTFAIVSGGAYFALPLLFPGDEEKGEPEPVTVKVARPEFGTLVNSLNLQGHLEAKYQVTLLPLVSGTLEELIVDVGDRVKKGDILGKIDPERYELQLRQAEAVYLSAQSSFERVARLQEANAVSVQNYEEAKGKYEAYRAEYELAQMQLGYTNITAPISGLVLGRHLSVGSLAGPERPLLTIANPSELQVRCQVPALYYEQFSRDFRSIKVSVSRNGGIPREGTIQRIAPYISPESRSFEAVVRLLPGEPAMVPGMFVQLAFEVERIEDAWYLPNTALAGGNTLWWVRDGRAVRETVHADGTEPKRFPQGVMVDPRWARRDVIVEGWFFLKEGAPVVVE